MGLRRALIKQVVGSNRVLVRRVEVGLINLFSLTPRFLASLIFKALLLQVSIFLVRCVCCRNGGYRGSSSNQYANPRGYQHGEQSRSTKSLLLGHGTFIARGTWAPNSLVQPYTRHRARSRAVRRTRHSTPDRDCDERRHSRSVAYRGRTLQATASVGTNPVQMAPASEDRRRPSTDTKPQLRPPRQPIRPGRTQLTNYRRRTRGHPRAGCPRSSSSAESGMPCPRPPRLRGSGA